MIFSDWEKVDYFVSILLDRPSPEWEAEEEEDAQEEGFPLRQRGREVAGEACWKGVFAQGGL